MKFSVLALSLALLASSASARRPARPGTPPPVKFGRQKTFPLDRAIHECCCENLCPLACEHTRTTSTFSSSGIVGVAEEVVVESTITEGVDCSKETQLIPGDADQSENQAFIDVCSCQHPGSGGDPHFKTWHGDYFDYHGQCDLNLLSNPTFQEDTGLDIHVRTTTRYDFSFIESAAVRVGEDTFEVSGFGAYQWNGISNADIGAAKMNGLDIHYEQTNEKTHVFTIDLGKKQTLVLKTFKDWVSVSLERPHPSDFHSSTGMMGDFATGLKLARDGFTSFDDSQLNEFGQEWQVLPNEPKLFQVVDRMPQSGAQQKCILPGAAKTEPTATTSERRRLGEKDAVSRKQAIEACEHLDCPKKREMCEYDVQASGDLEIAQAGAF